VSRQLGYDEGGEEDDDDEPEDVGEQTEPLVPSMSFEDSQFVGFNGRCNKKVDTCYAFWVTASLEVRLGNLFSVEKLSFPASD